MATHSSILTWKIPWKRSLEGYSPWGCKESATIERLTMPLSPEFSLFWPLCVDKYGTDEDVEVSRARHSN